ncbi:hypothetical protein FRIGORI9N_420083 [Frigoribacterium sp. 9N]|nr:hypothetical protein FRIGORI9N_420083 [Frigoribacterium sp. 9N]
MVASSGWWGRSPRVVATKHGTRRAWQKSARRGRERVEKRRSRGDPRDFHGMLIGGGHRRPLKLITVHSQRIVRHVPAGEGEDHGVSHVQQGNSSLPRQHPRRGRRHRPRGRRRRVPRPRRPLRLRQVDHPAHARGPRRGQLG